MLREGKLYDAKGNFLRDDISIRRSEYCNGLLRVWKRNKCGFIDKAGNQVIDYKFALASDFSDGLSVFKSRSKYGCIDVTGKEVIPPIFPCIMNFHGGISPAMIEDKWGFIDRTGKFVVEPQYYTVIRVSGGAWRIQRSKEGKQELGYIDTEGKLIGGRCFDATRDFAYGMGWVKEGNKIGAINIKGEMVIPLTENGKWHLRRHSDSVEVNNKNYIYV